MKYLAVLIFSLSLFLSVSAQPSQIHIDSEFSFDKELNVLMNELDLKNEQKLTIALLLLKYAAEFNVSGFEEASKTEQYNIMRKSIKNLDADLKGILDKGQYKKYKKAKKQIKKDLMKNSKEE